MNMKVTTADIDMEMVDIGIDSGMLVDSNAKNINYGETSGISDTVILTIVIIACVIIGIVLGIFAGKRSANK